MNEIILDNANRFSKEIVTFLFILLRTSIFVSMIPVIGSKKLPMQFRLGLAVFMSMLMTPVVNFEFAEDNIPMIVVREIFMGLALGFTVKMVFMAVNAAGSFISHMIGMSIATTFNPEMGQSTQIAEAYGIIAMLYFLVMNAHHDLIYVFVKSFELLPAGPLNIRPLIPQLLGMGKSFFILALKIGAPVIVCLMISHVLSGFLYKAAPQLNIFFVTLPLNIFLGFLLIITSFPILEYVLGMEFKGIREDMTRLIMMARG